MQNLGVDLRWSNFSGSSLFNELRFSHTWIIGKTGMGKSTEMIALAVDDIVNGDGIAFFDPHGDAIDEILQFVPPHRRRDTILYDPSDLEFPIAFNPLCNIDPDNRAFMANAMLDMFKSRWGDSWGPQLEQFLYNGVAALLDVPDSTLVGLKYLLTSRKYRKRVVGEPARGRREETGYVRDPVVKDFWRTDIAKHMPEKEQREKTLSTLNKIGKMISDPAIRNSIGQPRSRIDFNEIMDNGKILLVRLPQGRLGIDKASLIGSLLMSNLHLAALSRGDKRRPFHVYVDECQYFAPTTLAHMLSGIRKFGVSLTLAHQYLDALPDELRSALIGTVGTIIAFRLGFSDAEMLAPEFSFERGNRTFADLSPFTAYVRTGGVTSLVATRTPEGRKFPSSPRKIRRNNRIQYAVRRDIVDAKISRFIENNA